MYECHVLYIGSAPSVGTLKGVESLQEPLRQRFPKNLDDIEGIPAHLRVQPTALEVTYTLSGQVIHFPLDRLAICAGLRAVAAVDGSTGKISRQFVPVDKVELESANPTIFAAIIRRSKGRQIAECHMFICKSTRDALHLVNAAATANMALKKRGTKPRYEHEIPIVYSSNVNGYRPEVNGHHAETNAHNRESIHQQEAKCVKSTVGKMDPQHYQIKQTPPPARENEVIYITFDKTNLKPKGENTLELQSPRQTVQRGEKAQRRNYVDISSPRQHVQPFNPGMQNFLLRPIVAPQRIYTKRFIAPPPRFPAHSPVFHRSRRARSTSPIAGDYYTKADIRASGKHQRMWSGRPKSDVGFRVSRREQFGNTVGLPRNYMEDVFLYENAFAHGNDNRILRDSHGYYYPRTYDFDGKTPDARPSTKSNPKYSSSSRSDSNP